jgi:hypothetical protein
MFQIAQDDDGHLYVIPANRAKDFERWCWSEKVELPKWALCVNGPIGLVTFPEFDLRGRRHQPVVSNAGPETRDPSGRAARNPR